MQNIANNLTYINKLVHVDNARDSSKYDDLSTYSADVEGPVDLSESEKWENRGELCNSMSR